MDCKRLGSVIEKLGTSLAGRCFGEVSCLWHAVVLCSVLALLAEREKHNKACSVLLTTDSGQLNVRYEPDLIRLNGYVGKDVSSCCVATVLAKGPDEDPHH